MLWLPKSRDHEGRTGKAPLFKFIRMHCLKGPRANSIRILGFNVGKYLSTVWAKYTDYPNTGTLWLAHGNGSRVSLEDLQIG